MKIKIVHHSKTVGYSGTDRTAQLFCKYLDKDKFEPFIVYRLDDSNNQRLDIIRQWLGNDHVIGYNWEPGKKGRNPPYLPEVDNYFEIIQSIDPHIVHYHFSGYNEWPVFKYLSPKAKIVTTNIFGYNDLNKQADMTIYISNYIRDRAKDPNGLVLYNPIEQSVFENKFICKNKLLDRYNIPHNAILLGRVGRADNFDPISLKAFSEIGKHIQEAWYIVVNPCQGWIDTAKKLDIQNIRFVPPIIDDKELSEFYMGLDIYAHARHDGECCPTNIQEAMMHGLPIISHDSFIYNGQSEIIGDCGFCVPIDNWEAYKHVLEMLISNKDLRLDYGVKARNKAISCFDAQYITSKLENFYLTLLSSNV